MWDIDYYDYYGYYDSDDLDDYYDYHEGVHEYPDSGGGFDIDWVGGRYEDTY